MKRFYTLSTVLLVFTFLLPLKAQQLIKNSGVTGVCYAGQRVNRIYIPPPKEFYKKSESKKGGSIVIYYTGFPSAAVTAMEHAKSILETMLPADAKLTIKASWETIATTGVLGNSSITGYAGGWGIDALNPMAIYPVSLAEKIAGKSLNTDEEGDLVLKINKSINWYLGTDGNTPVNRYDLITVVMHEICHGLGFFDSMSTNNTMGWYGISSIPIIYDTFIENLAEKRLTDTLQFLNYSSALRGQLIGGQLYFNGPLLKNYTVLNHYAATRAKLWAPSVWDAGSSISHLDENVTPDINALMTPYINLGEAIHNPGEFTLSILGDLGWINTRIIHEPMHDTELNLPEVILSAQIKSDTSYNRNKVGVIYSFDNFLSRDTLFMSSPNSDDNFTLSIGIPSYNTELQYYFFAEDYFLRIYRSPSLSDSIKYTVFIGTDIVKPVITHTPRAYSLESIDTIGIRASVTDNLGVDTVYLEYIVNDGIPSTIGLQKGNDHNFNTILNSSVLNLSGGDSLRYRLFAIDSARVPNIAVLPQSGFFVTKIEDISSTLDRYSTDFTGSAANDFFMIGFKVLKPTGFTRYGLNSKHPYESPGENGQSIEYIAMLRHPLKFIESGMLINFRELVLVEPGEPGSLFGSPDFYDYVIVEGSSDFGLTWFSLADGYDSRYVKSWETSYNSSVIDGNSTFKGKESMLLNHTIYYRPSDKITAGDTLMIRFRLYSDPLANGWGWVIEDLNINSLIDAIEKTDYEPALVYPNPGNGIIKFNSDPDAVQLKEPVRYSIFNSTGNCILNGLTETDNETFADISAYPSGIYFIVIYLDDGISTTKYILLK